MSKYSQERMIRAKNRLRRFAQTGERIFPKEAEEAADIIEDLMLVVYGKQQELEVRG